MDQSMPLPGTVTSLTNTETPVRTGLPRPGQGIGYPNQTPVCPLRQSTEGGAIHLFPLPFRTLLNYTLLPDTPTSPGTGSFVITVVTGLGTIQTSTH